LVTPQRVGQQPGRAKRCRSDRLREFVVGSPIAETRRKLKRHRRSGKAADSTGSEDSSAAQAEDAKFVTRGTHHRPNRQCDAGATWGKQGRQAEGQRIGANRGSVSRRLRRTEAPGRNWGQERRRSQRAKKIRGDPEILSGEAGGWTGRGDSADSSHGAGGCSCGATRNWSSAIPNERGTGKPGNVPSAPPKGATFESPRRCVAGKAGRCRKRGDPEPVS
jgi:hypothetical protein